MWDENRQVYGVRKVWEQLLREGWLAGCCTVARLMMRLKLGGVVRGKVVKTTHSHKAQPCLLDRVNRPLQAERSTTGRGATASKLNWPRWTSVHWYNHRRLLGLIGHIPPAEAEEAYYRQQAGQAKVA